MSSGRSKKKQFHTGISRERFELLTTEGQAQASGDRNTNFNLLAKTDRLEKNNTTRFSDKKGAHGTPIVDKEATDQAKKEEEERRASFFQNISQKDLDELVGSFKQRQSQLITKSQFQGREQLIRTDRL